MGRESRLKGGIFGLGFGFGHLPYKNTTLIVCFVNIVIVLYVLRSRYSSFYFYFNKDYASTYTPDQIRKMEESVDIRRANEPIELVKMVKRKEHEFRRKISVVTLSPAVKHQVTGEILQRLRSLSSNASNTEQEEVVETWRKKKLKEAKKLALRRKGLDLALLQEEAWMLVKALESNWDALSQEIGLWLPTEINNQEHYDKPEGVVDKEEKEIILDGKTLPLQCNVELHTDYDGDAVTWGLTHHKNTAADCCQACLDQAKNAKPGENKCNIWVYCPSESGCYSPDIYKHEHMECWLKSSEKPKLNFKNIYSEAYRKSHPKAPVKVPWISGITSV